jgi:predicted nucleic acid-binding protein
MAAPDAQRILDDFRAIRFELTPIASLLGTAYRLAVTHQCTVYDALYLALSVQEQCRFVTADERLINTVGATLPGVTWVANW